MSDVQKEIAAQGTSILHTEQSGVVAQVVVSRTRQSTTGASTFLVSTATVGSGVSSSQVKVSEI